MLKDLLKANIKAEAIHGNKSQNARQRALSNFKDGTTRVLLATDIASRGIDVDNLTHVINYDYPIYLKPTYIELAVQGVRATSGIAFSFCDDEEKPYLKDIQKLIGKTVPVAENNPYPHTGLSVMPTGKPKVEQRNKGPKT